MLPLVLACAVCGAAERGLPANGAEVPFEDRKRATLDLRAAGFRETVGDGARVVELRAEPGFAMAVAKDTLVGADVPLLRRSIAGGVDGGGGGTRTDAMLGDVELRVVNTPYRSLSSRLTLDGGAKLPTAPIERDMTGALIAPDLQPGCSAIVPFAGVSYARMGSWWSAWTTATLVMPFRVRVTPHAGDSARASATFQVQPGSRVAARLGVFARYDGAAADVDGQTIARSGGGSVHVAPEIVLSPTTDLVLTIGAAIPVVQGMRAYRSTSPVALASAGFDF